jgi:hypothetical protein
VSDLGWIGVDLDGTLAEYHGWRLDGGIGAPIPLMLERVKKWLAEGREIKIFTARAVQSEQIPIVQKWLRDVGLPELEVTNVKDLKMVTLYDDRAVQVEFNTGRILGHDRVQAPVPAEAFKQAARKPLAPPLRTKATKTQPLSKRARE